jgi:hypothetical protein
MTKPKHVNDLMRDMFNNMPKNQDEKRQERIDARNREMPKICALLDIEYRPMKEDAA